MGRSDSIKKAGWPERKGQAKNTPNLAFRLGTHVLCRSIARLVTLNSTRTLVERRLYLNPKP